MTEFVSGKWEKAWNDLKKDFEKSTGKKKPSAKVDSWFRKPAGVESSLKACDAAFNGFTAATSKNKEAAQKTYRDAYELKLKAAKTALTSYGKTLANTIKSETDIDSTYVKGLDVLVKGIDALESSMDNQMQKLDAQMEKLDIRSIMAKTMRASVDAAVKRALLFAAKVKAKPAAETWNVGIKDAARDITQNIGNVERLRSLGYDFPGGDPANLFKVFDPWANEKRKFETGADPKLVLRELGAFVQAVQGIVKWSKT